MKVQDEELKKVAGGVVSEHQKANLGQEIPSDSIENYRFKTIYVVDKGDNKVWVHGMMLFKDHYQPWFSMKVDKTSSGHYVICGGVEVEPDNMVHEMNVNACKFYEDN